MVKSLNIKETNSSHFRNNLFEFVKEIEGLLKLHGIEVHYDFHQQNQFKILTIKPSDFSDKVKTFSFCNLKQPNPRIQKWLD